MISKPCTDNSPTMRKLSSGNGSSSAGSWRSQDSNSSRSREFSRPPIYNPEDYAASLKKWIGKASQKTSSPADQTDVTATSSANEGEMSLRQFLSISDLLNKLKTDLRLAYLSFVQEFVSDPIDGITLLLELLRSIQLNDNQQQVKVTPATHRRALLDENSCLQCLQYCLRCEETARRLAMSSAGLFTLAVCIMSSVSKSRIVSLELLSEICRYSHTSGHNAVSEAISTMRLRFGEPVRFRFLVSMLNGASTDLLIAGLQFINTFLETSPSKRIQLYIQAELEQAGLNSETFKKILSANENQDELVLEEFNRWSKSYVDIEVLANNYENKCKEVSALKEKISRLEAEVHILQNEKETLTARENSIKERFNDLEYRMAVSRTSSLDDDRRHRCDLTKRGGGLCGDGGGIVAVGGGGGGGVGGGGNSTPAEDEGISSSDQGDSDEMAAPTTAYAANGCYEPFAKTVDAVRRPYGVVTAITTTATTVADKFAEPTIDEVMEDFQNIINDVQNQQQQKQQQQQQHRYHHRLHHRVDDDGDVDDDDGDDGDTDNDGRVNGGSNAKLRRRVSNSTKSSAESLSEALILDKEYDIVPTRIVPEPPKKSRSLHLLANAKNIVETNPFFEDESAGGDHHSHYSCLTRCSYHDDVRSPAPSALALLPLSPSNGVAADGVGPPKFRHSYDGDDDDNNNAIKNCRAPIQTAGATKTLRAAGGVNGVVGGSHVAKSNLRRSETFHHLQIDTSASTGRGTVHKSRPIEKVLLPANACVVGDKPRTATKTSCCSGDGGSSSSNGSSANSRGSGGGRSGRTYASLQNYDNAEKELKRSASTKPTKGVGAAATVPVFPKMAAVSFFSKKTNFFPVNGQQQFTLKRHNNNAGLYSGKSHAPQPPLLPSGGGANHHHLHQVITITSEYPKRSLNGLKHINLNICDGKIMDLPSGLY